MQRQSISESIPNENKESLAITISLFHPSHEDIEKLKKRLDNSISNIIYKMQDSKSTDLISSIMSKWLYHMDNTPNDPYHLNHLKDVVQNEVKQNQSCDTKYSIGLSCGFYSFLFIWYLANIFCDGMRDKGHYNANSVLQLVPYKSHVTSRTHMSELGEPALWNERKYIINLLAPLVIIGIFLKTKPLYNAHKQKVKSINEINELIQESIKINNNLNDLVKTKGMTINQILSFEPIKEELQKILYKSNNKIKFT